MPDSTDRPPIAGINS
ncbi:unnamed protein product, partial [Didymodactylos carnosus]